MRGRALIPDVGSAGREVYPRACGVEPEVSISCSTEVYPRACGVELLGRRQISDIGSIPAHAG